VGPRGPETTKPLRRRLFGWPDTQGRCPPAGGRHWSCLGVLAVVPGRARRLDRSDPADQAPTVTAPEGRHGPRAQAVCGGPSLFSCRRPLGLAARPIAGR